VVNVLRHQPLDLVEFAAHYFAELLENRDQTRESIAGIMGIPAQDEEQFGASENDDMMDESEGTSCNVCSYSYTFRLTIVILSLFLSHLLRFHVPFMSKPSLFIYYTYNLAWT